MQRLAICYWIFASIVEGISTATPNASRLDFTIPPLSSFNESFPRYRYRGGIFGYVPGCTRAGLEAKNRGIRGDQTWSNSSCTLAASRRARGSTAPVVYFRHCLSSPGTSYCTYTSFARRRWFSGVPTLLDRCTRRPRAFPRPTTTGTQPGPISRLRNRQRSQMLNPHG